MDSPIVIPEAQSHPPGSSVRRRVSMDSNSPEFEFWMVRNPSFPQPNLLSADELFVDGILLPLHLRPTLPGPDPEPAPTEPEPETGPGPKITSSSSSSGVPSLSPSKRWRDIFKKGDKDKDKDKEKEKEKEKKNGKSEEKEKKKERKSGTGSTSSAELNINIWPFSRSRSAGNACTRPKPVFGAPTGSTRKVNSAPCSRSNSAGESKSRKWPSSPGRSGVHLGRSSPVWQVRRAGVAGVRTLEPSAAARNAEKAAAVKKDVPDFRRNKAAAAAGVGVPAKAKVLNLNVPMCIGYRNQMSCRSDDNGALGIGGGGGNSRGRGGGPTGGGGGRGGGVGGPTGSGNNLFYFRSLFTKKVY